MKTRIGAHKIASTSMLSLTFSRSVVASVIHSREDSEKNEKSSFTWVIIFVVAAVSLVILVCGCQWFEYRNRAVWIRKANEAPRVDQEDLPAYAPVAQPLNDPPAYQTEPNAGAEPNASADQIPLVERPQNAITRE
ncbi:hypothetical protein SCHPADRAFT_996725 [Schizopora paradoxa]|uniref:Uncharacterized protein n=1 Tax=Schizopora paradoxa TaxID=27342 RepID=A0A0H2RQL6_9AGAM|nr:hypothetical protein SCHPADRAFT_996725 [Schizopora paradoxa]